MNDGTIIYAFDPTTMSIDDWINGGSSDNGASNAENRNNIASSTTLYYADGTPLKVCVLNDGYTLVDYDGFGIEGIADNAYRLADGTTVYSVNPKQTSPEAVQEITKTLVASS